MEVLVAYDPKEADSITTARIISETFRRRGASVELQDLERKIVTTLDKYDVVVIGGSLKEGKISNRLSRFIQKYHDKLLSKKTYIFICSYYTDALFRKNVKKQIPEKLLHHSVTVNPV
jgi:menaquinone-dependent protoporphyrinogen oxidase